MKKMITLYADDGMVLTDGENYGTTVQLAVGADESKYYEITEAEYEEITAKEEEIENIF